MSGLLAGFIGGLAKGGLDVINDQENQQRKVEDDQRREASQMRIEEARAQVNLRAEAFKEQLKAKREEQKLARDANVMVHADQAADGALRDKGFDQFKRDLGATTMSDEEVRKVYDDQYHDRTVGDFKGAERYDVKESDRAKERLNQVQRAGASSGLINSAFNEYKDTATRERQTATDAQTRLRDEKRWEIEQNRFEETARSNRESERIRGIQAQAAATRADKYTPGGASGSGSEPKRTDLEAAAKVFRERIKMEVGGSSPDEIAENINSLERRAAKGNPTASAKLDRVRLAQTALQEKEDEILGYKQPPKEPKPTTAKIDTTQAISDAKRVLTMNPGARDEVIRRLKAAGIDTKGL